MVEQEMISQLVSEDVIFRILNLQRMVEASHIWQVLAY